RGPDRGSGSTPAVAARPRGPRLGPPRRQRRRWPLVLAALLALVVAAVAVMVRPVPKVAGQPQAVAVSRLRRAGLHASVHPQFSDTVGAGLVIAARSPFGPIGIRGAEVA